MNEKTIKKGVILNNKYNSFLNNSLKLTSNKIYTKPVILTQPNFQLDSHSFSKKRNLNIDEYITKIYFNPRYSHIIALLTKNNLHIHYFLIYQISLSKLHSLSTLLNITKS